MFRRLFPRLLLMSVTLAAALAAAEAFVRIRYEGRYAPRPRFYVADEHALKKNAPDLDEVFHGADYSIHVRTDEYGYRLGALGEIGDDRDLIVLSGDSYTFGWGVSTAESFASRFDELVSGRTGGRVRAVNLGVGGYGVFQSAVRLHDFLSTHAPGRVRAVVFTHCLNDATDNAKLGPLAAMLGRAVIEDPAASDAGHNRSRSHLLNMIRDVSDQQRIEDDLRATGARWRLELPDRFVIGKTEFDRARFGGDELNGSVMKARRRLSELQTELMREAVARLHGELDGLDVGVFHEFLYDTPGWYVRQVTALVREAPLRGGRLHLLGVVPARRSFEGPVRNRHAGGHFTPRMNAFWAERLFERLADHASELGL